MRALFTERLSQQIEEQRTQLAERSDQLAALEQRRVNELDTLEQQRQEQVTARNQQINELRTERSALQTEVARLEEFERLIETISGQYATFLGSDETDSSGPDAVLESKFRLETFLTEAEVAGLLPGLADRVREFDSQFEAAGREAGILDAADILDQFAALPNANQRAAFLTSEIERAADDAILLEFLTILGDL